ncbi:unnamed protein product [Lampetra planeri]
MEPPETVSELRQRLLKGVKKEVKQIMEEAVTRKFVHEDSSHIITFCASVESCLLHGLRRRAAGFLRSNKVAALFLKVGKSFPPASELCRRVQEMELLVENSRRASGREPMKRQTSAQKSANLSPQAIRHLWVRTALFEKVLDKVVLYLVENASVYYEKDALLADPVEGQLLASLLVGPCALEYTRMKTADHYWTDPSAQELVQRHRIHSPRGGRAESPSKRPTLHIKKRQSSAGSVSEDRPVTAARDYVESLHQSARNILLYGKNNVLVQPRGDVEPVPGYLSLHQAGERLTLKWTPNQLMNGSSPDPEHEKNVLWDYAITVHLEHIVYIHCHQQPESGGTLVLVSQDGIQRPPIHFPRGGHLLSFLSCLESGLAPRGQLDPPLCTHMSTGAVFPPLRKRLGRSHASEEDQSPCPHDGVAPDEAAAAAGTDYVFRIIYPGYRNDFITINYHHLSSSCMGSQAESSDEDDEDQDDDVDEMVSDSWGAAPAARHAGKSAQGRPVLANRLLAALLPTLLWPFRPAQHVTPNPSNYPSFSTKSFFSKPVCADCVPCPLVCFVSAPACSRTPLKSLCDNMRRQILSRAFFGWLAYCRHLSTVRTHLSALVNTDIVPADRPCDASGGLTQQLWAAMEAGTEEVSETEMVRLVYYGGVDPSVRHHVWPYLLGHYQLGMTASEKQQVDEDTRARFEDTSSAWRACQAAVQVREREREAGVTARSRAASPLAALGRLSSSAGSLEARLLRFGAFGSSVSSEVFESVDEVETHAGPEASTALQKCLPDLQLPYAPGEDSQPGLETQDSTDTHGTGSHAEVEGSPWEPEEQGMLGGADEAGCHGDGEAVPSPALGSPPSQPEPYSAVGDYTVRPASTLSLCRQEELDMYAMNFHRIDKDVHRCDRNFWFFTAGNLERLRRIMCSYVWEHLDVGYVQGMCDLLAPLLVILDDEVLAYSCFSQLMKRMIQNFPQGGAMDNHFANMRSLIQILDSEIFELMHRNGDYTHFFFCYRWFLLDFKRELVYDDVFAVWEAIWAARRVSSEHFVLFLALALVARYRDIILENNMDFTDIIRFFNEMAERHDARQLLAGARELVHRVQALIENK